MRMTPDDVSWLREYLVRIQDAVPRLRLDERVGGGATAGQLAFHAAESADQWIRHHMLGAERPRDRAAEFTGRPTRDDVLAALARALDACDELERRDLDLDEHGPTHPFGTRDWTLGRCLLHATAHTAEHAGHLEATLS
ncbi:MAG TPA: DinB family protein [Candidatus Dormibacteraeota bacterium]|jgi:uncharacterized damage-inducible protein DinB